MSVPRTNNYQDRDFKEMLIDKFYMDQDYSWVVQWVKDSFDPDSVFDFEQLEAWALDNGYVKEI